MLCVSVTGPTLEELGKQVDEAQSYGDALEFRVDLFDCVDEVALKALLKSAKVPTVLTLRSRSHGGAGAHTAEGRRGILWQLAALQPDYLDLEEPGDTPLIEKLATSYPKIKIILSHHSFDGENLHLNALYDGMKQKSAHFYKLASMTKDSSEALKMLLWAKERSSAAGNLVAVAMGDAATFTRVLGPIYGNAIAYAAVDDGALKGATGQLTAGVLCRRYGFKRLQSSSKAYGLIGSPVDGSVSDVTHNALFQKEGLDAIYVKMVVEPAILKEFLFMARKVPFYGLSVTMPLKEAVIASLDAIDGEAEAIGAVNTLVIADGTIKGYNTDGIGAINAIEKKIDESIAGKKIVIIGAGGASKAIAFEAKKRGGEVVILNRNSDRAHAVARALGCRSASLEEMAACAAEGYDIIVNGTATPMPISAEDLLGSAVAMEVKSKPLMSEFLVAAKKKGCRVIHGYEMFIEQALGQFHLWFGDTIDLDKTRSFLTREIDFTFP